MGGRGKHTRAADRRGDIRNGSEAIVNQAAMHMEECGQHFPRTGLLRGVRRQDDFQCKKGKKVQRILLLQYTPQVPRQGMLHPLHQSGAAGGTSAGRHPAACVACGIQPRSVCAVPYGAVQEEGEGRLFRQAVRAGHDQQQTGAGREDPEEAV